MTSPMFLDGELALLRQMCQRADFRDEHPDEADASAGRPLTNS
ncbi:hypothetical protein ACVWWN_006379 [Mycobacterium sp. URHB0021]|jgi:hypothetical protein